MSLLALLPLIVCAFVIVVAKRSALVGAGSGILVALLLINLNDSFSLSTASLTIALLDSLVLTLSAAIVILPGLYFNAIIKNHGAISVIQQWIECLPYSREHKTLLLLFGLLPAVESLTGFGVSLFLSIPLFFYFFSSPVAFRLSMLGMNIMPWGTMALSTVVGANLSGLAVYDLGWYSAITSSLVFPILSLVALYVIDGWKAVKINILAALGLSFGLAAMLLLLNYLHLTEISGVVAGLIVVSFGALLLPKEIVPFPPINKQQALRAFLPYLGVLLFIVIERLIPGLYVFLSNLFVISGSNTSLKILASPGMALLCVSLFIFLRHPTKLSHKVLLTRAQTSIFSLFSFIILAQLMRQGGLIAAFTSAVTQWNSDILLIFSPALGMVSGFITGSNLSGNALAMSVQSNIGANLGAVGAFAASQNSSAGHVVFTSIPIIVLILTIAKDVNSQAANETTVQEHQLLKFGLLVSVLIFFSLLLTTRLVYSLSF